MNLVYCVVGLGDCASFAPLGAGPGWQPPIQQVMTTIYCIVGVGPCVPI